MLMQPVSQHGPSSLPKRVNEARLGLWCQSIVNAIGLAVTVEGYFPSAEAVPDARVRLFANTLGVSALALLALTVVCAALITKRLAWVYVTSLALQVPVIAILLLTFEFRVLWSLGASAFVLWTLLHRDTRRWFFPPRPVLAPWSPNG